MTSSRSTSVTLLHWSASATSYRPGGRLNQLRGVPGQAVPMDCPRGAYSSLCSAREDLQQSAELPEQRGAVQVAVHPFEPLSFQLSVERPLVCGMCRLGKLKCPLRINGLSCVLLIPLLNVVDVPPNRPLLLQRLQARLCGRPATAAGLPASWTPCDCAGSREQLAPKQASSTSGGRRCISYFGVSAKSTCTSPGRSFGQLGTARRRKHRRSRLWDSQLVRAAEGATGTAPGRYRDPCAPPASRIDKMRAIFKSAASA
jgi:hypothetical protein